MDQQPIKWNVEKQQFDGDFDKFLEETGLTTDDLERMKDEYMDTYPELKKWVEKRKWLKAKS